MGAGGNRWLRSRPGKGPTGAALISFSDVSGRERPPLLTSRPPPLPAPPARPWGELDETGRGEREQETVTDASPVRSVKTIPSDRGSARRQLGASPAHPEPRAGVGFRVGLVLLVFTVRTGRGPGRRAGGEVPGREEDGRPGSVPSRKAGGSGLGSLCAGLDSGLWALGFCGRVGAGLAVLGSSPGAASLRSCLSSCFVSRIDSVLQRGSEQPRVAGRGMHY